VDTTGAPISTSYIDIYNRTEQAGAYTYTDCDGRFDFTVFGGIWTLMEFSPDDGVSNTLVRHVSLDVAVTNGLDQTNLQILVPRFTSQINGSVKDTSGGPIEGFFVQGKTTIHDQPFYTAGITDGQGQFQMPAFEADWRVSGEQRLSYFSGSFTSAYWHISPTETVTVSHTNATVELLVEPATITARLAGRIVDSAGAPVSQISISASSSDGQSYTSLLSGYSGGFELGVSRGIWAMSVNNFQDGDKFFLGPRVSFNVEDGMDQTNLLLIAQKATAKITGEVRDTEGHAVSGLYWSASTELDGTNYSVGRITDRYGRFEFEVMDASWRVVLSDASLNSLGFRSVPAQNVTMAGMIQAVFFVARRIIGDGRVPTLASPLRLGDGLISLRVESQTTRRYRVDASPNLRDWAPIWTNATQGGSFILTDSDSTNALTRFYRAVLLE
jgi:hypothetical protein